MWDVTFKVYNPIASIPAQRFKINPDTYVCV